MINDRKKVTICDACCLSFCTLNQRLCSLFTVSNSQIISHSFSYFSDASTSNSLGEFLHFSSNLQWLPWEFVVSHLIFVTANSPTCKEIQLPSLGTFFTHLYSDRVISSRQCPRGNLTINSSSTWLKTRILNFLCVQSFLDIYKDHWSLRNWASMTGNLHILAVYESRKHLLHILHDLTFPSSHPSTQHTFAKCSHPHFCNNPSCCLNCTHMH